MSELATRTPGLIATEINKIKEDTRRILIYNSIEIGRKLVEAKELVTHGDWGNWLETEVNYSKSTANNLMKIFVEFGADQISLIGDNLKSQTFGNLNYSQAILLFGVPEDEREKFIEENKVEEMSTRELKKAIEDLKKTEEEKQRALEEKEKVEKEAKELEEANKVLEEAFNANAKERRKVEEEKDKLQENIRVLEDKINELNKQPTVINVDSTEIENEYKRKLEELKANNEVLQRKLLASKEDRDEAAERFKFKFDRVVTSYQKLLEELAIIKSEDEIQHKKLNEATKKFLNAMLDRL